MKYLFRLQFEILSVYLVNEVGRLTSVEVVCVFE